MLAHIAAAAFYIAGAIALAAIIHTARAQWPAIRKLLAEVREQGE